MPNYCDNILTLTGKQKNIIEFLNDFAIKNENGVLEFSMTKIVPQPFPSDTEGFNWYNWRLENWGCKWDIDCNIDAKETYDEVIASGSPDDYLSVSIPYTTPWGPNLEFIQKASFIYGDIIFNIKYYEPGCELAGDFTYAYGDETENYIYDSDDPFEYYVWLIDNDFEDIDYVLNEMELEETDNMLYKRLYEYFYPTEQEEENVIDLTHTFLSNNLPEPK